MGMCPNCNKRQLLYNYDLKRWECPKERLSRKGIMEKYGCGYVQDRNPQTDLNFRSF
jgi:hypothetical protein